MRSVQTVCFSVAVQMERDKSSVSLILQCSRHNRASVLTIAAGLEALLSRNNCWPVCLFIQWSSDQNVRSSPHPLPGSEVDDAIVISILSMSPCYSSIGITSDPYDSRCLSYRYLRRCFEFEKSEEIISKLRIESRSRYDTRQQQ